MKFKALKLLLSTTLLFGAMHAFAHDEKVQPGADNSTPKELEDVGIAEHLGAQVDTDLVFKDEKGQPVRLAEFYHHEKPVVLDLAYYACPGLCNYHLNGFSEALKGAKLTAGRDYEWVVVSFDPKETPALAAEKKKNMVAAMGQVEAAQGWHFLTGEKANIDALAKQVGFSYHWVEADRQYAHASAAYVTTPEAKISRYLKGVQFDPQTIRLSLLEAKGGGVSHVVDSLILYCFHYDAKASKYSLQIMGIARIAGALMVLILIAVIGPNLLRNRKSEK